jgi:hypothetical protein
MENLNLKAIAIMTIIPSGVNYKTAILFYLEIGFTLDWESEQMCLFSKDSCRFLLQNNRSNWAHDNFMMVLDVENLSDWWKKLEALKLKKSTRE